ncbi:MAG: hypothetical protein H0S80_08775 [Desulfovibrionaceae bacterium]|nr:hypothetical protein [Desulfovibrionaceae bacterium]
MILFLFALARAALAADPGVLLLHGDAGPTPWTDGLAAGAVEEAGGKAAIQREYLGGLAHDAEAVYDFAQRLKERLHGPVRVVVATDATAAAFAAKYREDLFPEAAMVLAGADRIGADRLTLCGECAALGFETDLDGTLDLIFALRPGTRLVAGIADGTPAGRAARESLKRAMERRRNKATLIFPGHEPGDDNGLDLDGLADVLSNMPSHGVAVLLRFAEDNAGSPVDAGRLYHVLETRLGSPVFVLTDAMLGSGVAGGVLVTGRETGRRAVRLAQRILAGEPVREMLPEPVKAQTVLDGTALARFGMRPVDGAIVVNRPAAPETTDGLAPGFAPLVLAILLAFVAALFLLRRYRQNR